MPKPQRTKTSLAELLAQRPEPPRNDWSNGRPGAPANGRQDDDEEFLKHPRDFESGEEAEEDDGPSPGGAFAILAALTGAEAEGDEWITVTAKQKKKASVQAPAAAPTASAASRRPTVPTAPATQPAAPALPRPAASGPSAGLSRAPYIVAQATAAALRPARAQTHDVEGRPISDTYYQTFQSVYCNSNGAVCMRFHKTDVVMVRPNGDVVLTSGGYRTRTTYCSVQEALEPLGLSLTSTGGAGRWDWQVVDSDGTKTPWEDGMVLTAKQLADRRRGQRLLAAYGVGTAASAASVGAATRAPVPVAAAAPPPPPKAQTAASAPATSPSIPVTVPAPVPVPVPVPVPAPAPAPTSTWSYRSAAGAGAIPAYMPHLRPVPAAASAAAAAKTAGPPSSSAAAASVSLPTPRTAESIAQLQRVLSAALAIQDDAAARGQSSSGSGGPIGAAGPAAGAGGGGGGGSAGGGPVANGGNAAAAAAAAGCGEVLDDEHACIACMAALKTTLLIPCGHMVMCGSCAAQVLERSGVCPMCRMGVVDHLTISST